MGRIRNSFIISTPVTEPFLDVPNVLTILQKSVNQNVTPPSYSNNATKITPIDASSCVRKVDFYTKSKNRKEKKRNKRNKVPE